LHFYFRAQHLGRVGWCLRAVTTRGCRRRRTGRVGRLLVACRRALTHTSLWCRDAAAAVLATSRPPVAAASPLAAYPAARLPATARPGSARRRVRVRAGRPDCRAQFPPLPRCFTQARPPVRASSSYRSGVTRPLTSPPRAVALLQTRCPHFHPQAAVNFQFFSATASSPSLPADRPLCASSLAPLCSNWSFSALPGFKAELGHVSWQPISLSLAFPIYRANRFATTSAPPRAPLSDRYRHRGAAGAVVPPRCATASLGPHVASLLGRSTASTSAVARS
jgi:hypothetical protein